MKTKTLFAHNLSIGIIGLLLYGGGTLFIFGCCVVAFVGYLKNEIPMPSILFAFLEVGGIGVSILCAFTTREFSNRSLAWLTIKEDTIAWHCPFYRPVKMNIDECIHIGINDMNDHRGGLPILRGDEYAFIYISTTPLPDKYHHKMDTAKCKKGFIRIPYSDKLAKALVEWLPDERGNQVRAFYCRMQVNTQLLHKALKKGRGRHRGRKNRKNMK